MLMLLLLPLFSLTLPMPPHCYYFKLLWNRKRTNNKNTQTEPKPNHVQVVAYSHPELFLMITENISFRQFLFVFDFFIPLEWNYFEVFLLFHFLFVFRRVFLLSKLFHPSSKWIKMPALALLCLCDRGNFWCVSAQLLYMYIRRQRHVRTKWKRVWMNNKCTHERA